MSTINITAADVRGVFARIPDALDVSPMIDAATTLVTDNLVGKGMSDATLTLITKYIAAHFTLISLYSEPKYEEIERTRNEYNFKPGQGLASTRFGQQAIFIDTSGVLALMGTSQPYARFTLVKPSKTTWYYDVYRILAAQFTG